jgi:hypothetical protein
MATTGKDITWMALNELLRNTNDERQLQKLLSNERNGKRRPTWMLRIYQRYNRVRYLREQKELLQS